MSAPTLEQLGDYDWWVRNAPQGAEVFCPGTREHPPTWWKDIYYDQGLCILAEDPSDNWSVEFMQPEELRVAIYRPKVTTEAPDLFYEAIGWTYAQCCVWLDEGKDPRTEDCNQLVEMAERDFGITRETTNDRNHD
jgi:hypothetical protein